MIFADVFFLVRCCVRCFVCLLFALVVWLLFVCRCFDICLGDYLLALIVCVGCCWFDLLVVVVGALVVRCNSIFPQQTTTTTTRTTTTTTTALGVATVWCCC